MENTRKRGLMNYRYLHTSDWHFGASRRLTPRSLDYLERHKKALRSVIKLGIKEEIDFFIVAGDIFESAGTSIEEFLAAHEIFSEAADVAPVIVTAGNHDELAVGEFQTEWLRLLNIPNVHFISQPTLINLPIKGGSVAIAAIPWLGYKEQEKFDAVVAPLAQKADICMLHECFVGSTLDTGRISTTGVKVPYFPNVKYYALGDIHKYQKIDWDNCFFSGSPLQYNFGDKLPKGVILVEAKDDIHHATFKPIASGIELHNITSLDEIPADSPHWYKLRCEGAKIPRQLPECVKVVEPVAGKVVLPEVVTQVLANGEKQDVRVVDFSEGVESLLLSNGFNADEIKDSVEQVEKVVQSQ
jgi:hypothetical protein